MKTDTQHRTATAPHSQAAGFTLVELLAVIAVIMLLLGFTLRSIGPQGGFALNQGGNLVADLVHQARQNAMAKGKMTLLALIDDSSLGVKNHRRVFILMEKGHDDTEWKAAGKWERLPQGIIAADPASGDASFFSQTPTVVMGDFPKLEGATISPGSCKYQVFMPNGRLSTRGISNPDSPVIRLVEEKELARTPPNNYYDVRLNCHTGTPVIERP